MEPRCVEVSWDPRAWESSEAIRLRCTLPLDDIGLGRTNEVAEGFGFNGEDTNADEKEREGGLEEGVG
jgi:hypothetical protein